MEPEPVEKVARVRLGSYEFKKRGVSRFDLRDPYRIAVALTWPQFLAVLLALYLSVNVVFATLFWLVPGSVANVRQNSFADNLFFSIETLATVGYGEMYPATLYGRMVASTEIVCGLAFTAILTGLTFVRFSRPRAKLIFAANPVVAMHNGKPTLMVRIGNGNTAVLTDGAAKLNIFFTTPPQRASSSAARKSCGLNGGTFPSLQSFGHSCMCWTNGVRCTATMRCERLKQTRACL
jgi:inward rectifier potassium channel